MREEVIKKAKALAAQLPDGPWGWRGYKEHVKLCTLHSGQLYLMAAARAGLQGAQFCFQNFGAPKEKDPRNGFGGTGLLMGIQDGLYVPRARYAPNDIDEIASPLAQLIEMLPEIIEALGESS